MTITHGACTHVGHVRDHNEDNYLAKPSLGLWLVADGMGGHACGEVASEIATHTIGDAVAEGDDLVDAVLKAHEAILDAVDEGVGKAGMGTTVVALRLEGPDYTVAWVGDSRAYLWDEELTQISKDHSLVQELIDGGKIAEEQAMHHPHRNIINQNLGADDLDDIKVDVETGQLKPGQKILLCSDGLSDEITKDEIAEVIADVIAEGGDDQQIADRLVERVLEEVAHDNITVIVVTAS